MKIHGKLVDIHNQTIFAAVVTVEEGRITSIRRNSHRGSLFILPGFFDAHAHLETTFMLPSEFANISIRHGTVSAKFASRYLNKVIGADGIEVLQKNAARTPFKSLFSNFYNTHLVHCSTLSEARARYSDGEEILVTTSNLQTLLPLLNEDPKRCLLCSNHLSPDHFALGHINLIIKRAIELGMDPIDAIIAGTYREEPNAGLLREGDPADFVLVENLEALRVLETYINGSLVFKGNSFLPNVPIPHIDPITYPMIKPENLHFPENGEKIPHFILSENFSPYQAKQVFHNTNENQFLPDANRDILKLVRIDKKGNPKIESIEGLGLKKGAIAFSFSGDLISSGTNDQDISHSLNALAKIGGGLAISINGKTDTLPLPIYGLFSSEKGEEISLRYSNLEMAVKACGCSLKNPFTDLALALKANDF